MLKININNLSFQQKEILTNFMYYINGQKCSNASSSDFLELNNTKINSPTFLILCEWLNSQNIPYTILPSDSIENDISLPITEIKSITSFQPHVLLLQIPFLNEKIFPWYHCNFINIFYYQLFCYDYINTYDFFEKISYFSRLTYQDIPKINSISFFFDCLNKGNYIFVWTDKFYLAETSAYKKAHDIHPILLHGYNSKSKSYLCTYFEISSGLHTTLIDVAQIHKSLESACFLGVNMVDRPIAYIIKPMLFTGEYTFFIKRFLEELYNYINGNGDEKEVFFFVREEILINKLHFGISVTREFIKGLLLHHSAPFDYRLIHLIVENKKKILESLLFLKKEYIFETQEINIFDYEKVVEAYDHVRIKYIKYSLMENNSKTFYPAPTNKKQVTELCSMLSDLLKKEKKIISKIYSNILDALSSENDYGSINEIHNVSIKNTIDNSCFVSNIDISQSGIKYARICNYKFPVRGIIAINNQVQEIDLSTSYDKKEFFLFEHSIHSIICKLYNYTIDKMINPMYVCLCKNNLSCHITNISCSSIYSGRTDLSFSPEETLTFNRESFWSPDINDTTPYIIYELKNNVTVNRLNILQHYGAIRVKKFSVLYSNDNVSWKTIIQVNEKLSLKPYIAYFPPVEGKYFKLKIEETIMDITGYNIPNICFFDLSYN